MAVWDNFGPSVEVRVQELGKHKAEGGEESAKSKTAMPRNVWISLKLFIKTE